MKVQQIKPDNTCSTCKGDGFLCQRSEIVVALTNARFPELCLCIESQIENDADVVQLIAINGGVFFESISFELQCGRGCGRATVVCWGLPYCKDCYVDAVQATQRVMC